MYFNGTVNVILVSDLYRITSCTDNHIFSQYKRNLCQHCLYKNRSVNIKYIYNVLRARNHLWGLNWFELGWLNLPFNSFIHNKYPSRKNFDILPKTLSNSQDYIWCISTRLEIAWKLNETRCCANHLFVRNRTNHVKINWQSVCEDHVTDINQRVPVKTCE